MDVVPPHGLEAAGLEDGGPKGEIGAVDYGRGDGDGAFWRGGVEGDGLEEVLAFDLDAVALVGADEPVRGVGGGFVEGGVGFGVGF